MPIQLSGSLVITGSITTTGVITMSGSIASASYSSNSDLLQGTGSVGFATTASLLAVSSSQQQISASLLNVIAIGATTGSNSFRATQSITGSLTVTGQIIAQTINVQQVTSSIIYSSGSNVFGCDLNSRQTFTGSVLITGSLTIAGASSAASYSGTTIYGSTAVCSAVGKFTTCIDAGSGTFSSGVTATQLSVNTTNTTGKINIQGPNDSGLLYLFNSCANARFMFNNYYGYGIDAMIIQEFNTSNVLQRDIIAFATCGKVGIGTATPGGVLDAGCSVFDATTIFRRKSQTGDAGWTALRLVSEKTTAAGAGFGTAISFLITDSVNTNCSLADLVVERDGSNFCGAYSFRTYAGSGTGVERMRITSAGNVGISATDPVKTLDVRGTLAISNNASSYWYMDRSDDDGRFKILTDGNSEKFSIATTGVAIFSGSVQGNGGIFSGTGASAATMGGKAAAASGLTDKDLTLSAWYPTSGTNEYGGDLYLAAGRPTGGGSGKYGTVYIQAGIGNGTSNVAGSVGTVIAANNTLLQFFNATSETASPTERMRINSSGNIGIGTTGPQARLQVSCTANFGAILKISDTTTESTGIIALGDGNTSVVNVGIWRAAANCMSSYGNWLNLGGYDGILFATCATGIGSQAERMRITNTGDIFIGTTTTGAGERLIVAKSEAAPLALNRLSSDGGILRFYQDSAEEGNVSVAGATVSYNSFLGSHWSQLQDGSKPTILKGTILEAIDELCVWENETNDRLPKSKISDTIESKNVYGIFLAWDEEWESTNDFFVAAVGLGYIRVHSSQNVTIGDLLQSNGDGTAKIQSDSIMSSSTIAKVVSTQKIETYEDGSYLIAATLHCG